MPRLVFCLNCGVCLGKDKPKVAKEHLRNFPNHTNYLTKTIIDPLLLHDPDSWFRRKFRNQPRGNRENYQPDSSQNHFQKNYLEINGN